jgi:hypothetical protein
MKRILMAVLVLVAAAFGVTPAEAVTITYGTSGSNAQVFLNPTSSGDITANSNFNLTEQLVFGDTSNGHYGEAITYIPFTVSSAAFLSATVADLNMSNPAATPLEWLTLSLYEYTGSGFSYLGCGSGSSLCTLQAYDSDPPVASIYSALVAGTQYLLRVGFGLCGCTGEFGGIQLTVATTPIPPAILMFVSALFGMGGMVWRRRRAATTVGSVA